MSINGTPLWEFLPIIAMSLLFLSSLTGRSPRSIVERFLVEPAPSSLHDIRCWYTRSFNSTQWVIQFEIAPDDFEHVLARYPFKKAENPHGYDLPQLREYIGDDGSFPVEYPAEPMVVCYKYRQVFERGRSKDVTIYANEQRSLVYAIGGSG